MAKGAPVLTLVVNPKPVVRLDADARVDAFIWCLLTTEDDASFEKAYAEYRTAMRRADLKPVD